MRLNENGDSFGFHRGIFPNRDDDSKSKCRKKLQDRFNDSGNSKSSKNNRSVLSILSINNSRKMLRTGAEKIHKGINDFRTTVSSISQRFRGTKRRRILEETAFTPNCATPLTFSKNILGRTPTKLYSPFGFESPYSNANTAQHQESKTPIVNGIKEKKMNKIKRLILMR